MPVLNSNAIPPNSLAAGATRIALCRSQAIADQLDFGDDLIEAKEVCLDFAEIESVNSAELSALIRFSLRARRLDKSVALCNVGPVLEEVFEMTRFGAWSIE